MNILTRWLDNNSVPLSSSNKIDWARIVPFVMLHLSCLLIFIVGVSKVAIIIALTLYWARIFSIGAFYHRYFSHRTFKTNRAWQFIFAVLGSSSAQRGPIWWAAHHRQASSSGHRYRKRPAFTMESIILEKPSWLVLNQQKLSL